MRYLTIPVLAIAVVVAIILAPGGAEVTGDAQAPVQTQLQPVQLQTAQVERQVPRSAEAMRLSFAPIVKQAAPAVVNVYASRTRERQVSPFFNDPFFSRFFGNGFPGMPRERAERSLGSGVIVDPSGIIMTNLHVIAGADEIKVTLADKTEADCEIVLKDDRSDLAVLRITDRTGPFPYLALANSDALEVGDLVLAIGNPFGVGQTVTSGIISALDRTSVGQLGENDYFIQTDAAINPGNSGGALIDMDGRLVGINTMIVSRSGGSIGIGFAVPSNMVSVVARSAQTGERVRRPWIGASFQRLTPEIAAGLGVDQARGALVTGVVEGGPAAAAGLQPGDLIVSVDGFEIDDPGGFGYRIATKGIGEDVEIVLRRSGKRFATALSLQAAPETVPREPIEIGGASPMSGATVMNLSPAVAEELSFSGATSGVVVAEVAPGSPADRFGLRPGDVMVDVNGVEIDSTKRLAEVAAQNARRWQFVIKRGDRVLRTVIGG